MKMGTKIVLTAAAMACLAAAPSNASAAGRHSTMEPSADAWQARAQVLLADTKQLVRDFQQLEARLALLEKDVRESKERQAALFSRRAK